MKIYALVGPSGTGKSHRAQQILFDYNIDLLIDDGLVIKGSNIISGISAKKQKTKLGAIKTAIFSDDQHREDAIKKIKTSNPSKILILGTSKDMTKVIAQRLALPLPDQYISIYDIASKKEIEKALYVRNSLGRHVIPAPTLEVKKNLPESIIEPLHLFLTKKNTRTSRKYQQNKKIIEQSVTQPTFTPMGNLLISHQAIEDLVLITLKKIDDIAEVKELKINKHVIGISFSISLNIYYGSNLHQISLQAQKEILKIFDDLTNLPVEKVDILVSNLSFKN